MTQERKANILLVDDHPENLVALKAVLEPLRQNLVCAGSGQEALKKVLHEDFTLILLDVQMPGVDGFETAAHIKQRDKTRDIPIIFLTAILRGFSEGAVDYLLKPFDPAVLRGKVQVFLDLFEKDRALRESEELFRGAFEHAPVGVALVGLETGGGRFIRVNNALCNMTGYSEAELLSTTLASLTDPEEEGDPALLADELPGYQLETRLRHERGESFPVLLGTSMVRDADGDSAYAVVQIQDLTERKRAQEELTLAREELARRQAQRDQALEINDNVVQGLALAKLAIENGSVARVRHAIDDALESAQHMISDLLEGPPPLPGDLRRSDKATLTQD
jgi:PAS domain S-box-containing protein